MTTSYVKLSFRRVFNAGARNNGARAIHFYEPGGANFDLQGRLDLESGSWETLPKGCSYQSSLGGDNAAYWNSHNTGCGGPNCGGYTSVLADLNKDMFMPLQSSRPEGGFGPYEAVDGNTGFDWKHFGSMSCVTTEVETSPWYQIDLGSVRNITTIVYHARRCGGSCNEQTHGFDVYVDNTLFVSNVKPKVGDVIRFEFYQMGRVIKIINQGKLKVITFCELEVNVAREPNADGYYVSRPAAEEKALRHVLKLLAISPDFHATNFHNTKPEVRKLPLEQTSKGRQYKAVVVVYLAGGADSFNIVVPHGGNAKHPNGDFKSDCKKLKANSGAQMGASEFEEHDLYNEYRLERGLQEALAKSQLLEIDVPGNDQPCKTFGLHPSTRNIQKLYNDGDAVLLANMGSLVEPITLQDWKQGSTHGAQKLDAGAKKLPPGLFGHNIMQKNAWTVHADNRDAKGILGRMVTKFTNRSEPLKSAMYSIQGYQQMLTGAPFAPDIINAGEGLVQFGNYDSLAEGVKAMTCNQSESLLAETYAAALESSIRATETLGNILRNTTLKSGNDFTSKLTGKKSHLANQFQEVAKVVQIDNTELQTERSMFYTQIGGWDTHSSMDISMQLSYVDEAVGMLADELKEQGASRFQLTMSRLVFFSTGPKS